MNVDLENVNYLNVGTSLPSKKVSSDELGCSHMALGLFLAQRWVEQQWDVTFLPLM